MIYLCLAGLPAVAQAVAQAADGEPDGQAVSERVSEVSSDLPHVVYPWFSRPRGADEDYDTWQGDWSAVYDLVKQILSAKVM